MRVGITTTIVVINVAGVTSGGIAACDAPVSAPNARRPPIIEGSSDGAAADGHRAPVREAGPPALGQASEAASFLLPACDAGGTATKAEDAAAPLGDPPPDCIAPCVWKVIKQCRPVGACTKQEIPSPLPWNGSVSCAPENQWWEISSPAHLASRLDVYLGSRLCYSFYGKNIGGTLGFNPNSVIMEWSDGQGQAVATGVGYPHTTIFCGFYAPIDPDSVTPGSGDYLVDDTQPHCEPWTRTRCRPGCCDGNPPALPVVDFSL